MADETEIGVYSVETAKLVLRVIEELQRRGYGSTSGNNSPSQFGRIFKTPVGGIPARVSDTPGSAACVPYYIDENDDLVEQKLFDGTSQTIDVFHVGGDDVAEEVYIQAHRVSGRWVAVMEDCS